MFNLNLNILKQRKGEISLKNGMTKIYISDNTLEKINFKKGVRFNTIIDKIKNIIMFVPDENGKNIVSEKKGKSTPVIDKCGVEIREVLDQCSEIYLYFGLEGNKGRIIIEGRKSTASLTATSEDKERKITSISFCAGAGISSWTEKMAGFEKVAFNEYNPKTESEDKFANIFSKNFPDTAVFNVPMQSLKASDLPSADYWSCTLDCTDYSKLSAGKTEFHTMHLFMHMMRLFWEKPKEDRPKAILIENVEGFEKVAGNSLKLCFQEEGYHVTMGKLNSLDYGSRTRRERFFFVASCYEGFQFPEFEERKLTPISEDGVMTVESIDWITAEESNTLKHFVEREKGKMTHNHKMLTYDITKDAHIGTIAKSHHKYVPENILRHPNDKEKFAFIRNEKHLRYLHGIDENIYLGDSITTIIQSIGQGVCSTTFYKIAKQLFDFLQKNMFKSKQHTIFNEVEYNNNPYAKQLCLCI